MRLIDADKLIEKLRDFKEWENDDGRPIHTMSETQRIDRCINFVQMEPTAYDIDKVVEELESFAKLAEDRWVNGTSKYAYQEHKCWVKAIEIVKRGYVSADDVCEYKKHRIIDNVKMYDSSCLHELEERCAKKYRYCPYCGKKIKVVE